MYYEHHVHLYGCLTAEDVWLLGREVWQQRHAQLDWFADSYRRGFGVDPQYQKFWQSDAGYDLLRMAYEVNTGLSFAQFQAKCNLLHALFPLNAKSCEQIWERVLTRDMASGLIYAEYRTMYPATMAVEHFRMVNAILARKVAASGKSFQPRFAISLARQPDLAISQYQQLAALKDELTYLTAIDLCGDEEDYPPQLYQQLFALIRADNERSKRKLAILAHVGESFSRVHVASSIRWVVQAHMLGVQRLGHAIALGVEIASMEGKTVKESRAERAAHLRWLADNPLSDYGYVCDQQFLQAESQRLELAGNAVNGVVELSYDDASMQDTMALQAAALRYAQDKGMVIESCPTSNRYLASIDADEHHPLVKFAEHDLTLTISADDPGIFVTNIAQEWEIAARLVPASFLQKLKTQQSLLCSEKLISSRLY
ncbi:MAG: hypothetical protein OYH77_03485 [Pseudomonadota bacterium]|nr:hypothetical protein [Pseudomonadota bacterium]